MRSAIEGFPYAEFLGVEVIHDQDGLVLVMPFRDDLVGNARLPAIHGGVVGAFLELTAAIGLIRENPGRRSPRPINFSVNYLRSVGPHETFGRAEIVKHGRRIANVRVIAWQEDPDQPVAAGTGNFLL